MNKTQCELVTRLVNRYLQGSAKEGWTLTVSKDLIFLTLQKLNEINQAYNLADKYPDIFRIDSKSWRNVNLFLLDDQKARNLLSSFNS
jgi:hypothetical protein